MSVEEYSLKFTQLSKYDPSLVSNHKDKMSRFVTWISDLVKNSCIRQLFMKTLISLDSWYMLNIWKSLN